MTDQKTKAEQFRALHVPGAPLVLFNVWDAGSAQALVSTNSPALATSSWAVAAAHGLEDGEKLPLELAIANLKRIVAVTNLPVSVDIEGGYDDPARTIEQTIEAGAIGCNIEDSNSLDGTLRGISDQADRIRQARRAGDAAGIAYFINARTDVFLQKHGDVGALLLRSAIDRAQAYADAGADGLFVPGLADMEDIAHLVAASPLPINVMLDANSPKPDMFARAGVARISYGPAPYLLAMKAIQDASCHDFVG